jgi:hypothetical protein
MCRKHVLQEQIWRAAFWNRSLRFLGQRHGSALYNHLGKESFVLNFILKIF